MSTEPVAGSRLMSLLAGATDKSDRLTFAVVAGASPNQSLARTSAIALPAAFDDTRTESFAATTWLATTVILAIPCAQLDGLAASQIWYTSEWSPKGVSFATTTDPLAR